MHLSSHIIFFTLALFGLTACIGLKPTPDKTKMYALGLTEPVQNSSNDPAIVGYIARPQLPVYMEGHGLKFISNDREIADLPAARWAEPIDVGVARAVSCYIEALGDGFKSDFYPWTCTNDEAFKLQLDFNHLIATSDGRILIAANWQYKHGADKTETGVFANNTIEWSPGDAQSMVEGINEALKLLAAEIVHYLKKEALTAK